MVTENTFTTSDITITVQNALSMDLDPETMTGSAQNHLSSQWLWQSLSQKPC